jgi:hypothetical protein
LRHVHASGICQYWWKNDNGKESFDHPFPATIDGAASAMPKGWTLFALEETGPMSGWSSSAIRHTGKVRQVFAHGDNEIATRYLLAKLAWEHEHATNDASGALTRGKEAK